MEIGIDSFAAFLPDSSDQAFVPASQRMADLLAEVETADRVGLDAFGIGEHHRAEFLDSAPAIIGGSFARFRPLVDLYYEAGQRAGHAREDLKIAIHAMGFVGETDEAARNSFYPGWESVMNKIGAERGFPPASRAQFNALCGPDGAFLVGSPQTVRDKMIGADKVMGGISRITFQMSTAMLDTAQMQKSITLLGEQVAPQVRAALGT